MPATQYIRRLEFQINRGFSVSTLTNIIVSYTGRERGPDTIPINKLIDKTGGTYSINKFDILNAIIDDKKRYSFFKNLFENNFNIYGDSIYFETNSNIQVIIEATEESLVIVVQPAEQGKTFVVGGRRRRKSSKRRASRKSGGRRRRGTRRPKY